LDKKNSSDSSFTSNETTKALALKFQGSTLRSARDDDYDMIRKVYQAMGQGEFLE
jgi:hypothetical protein